LDFSEEQIMAGIFISYRRDDSAGWVGRLATDLQERFGQETVFQDIGAIGAGEDFVAAIERSLESCSAVLVVIGPEWSRVKDRAGIRRLDNPDDTVRIEVAKALARKDHLVIPVLVGGAQMPTAAELPSELWALARRNALELSDKRWTYDLEQLMASLMKNTGLAQRAQPALPDPLEEIDRSSDWKARSRGVVLAYKGIVLVYFLWFFLGVLGVHSFYMGKVRWGLFYIGLTFIGSGLIIAGQQSNQNMVMIAAGVLAFIVFEIFWLWDLVTIPRQLKRRQESIKQPLNG
jgi:TM2 domain-containing membrane protein YozV